MMERVTTLVTHRRHKLEQFSSSTLLKSSYKTKASGGLTKKYIKFKTLIFERIPNMINNTEMVWGITGLRTSTGGVHQVSASKEVFLNLGKIQGYSVLILPPCSIFTFLNSFQLALISLYKGMDAVAQGHFSRAGVWSQKGT